MLKTLELARKQVTAFVGAGTTAIALGILAAASPDGIIERSFERAMTKNDELQTEGGQFASGPGSEDHWLRSPSADQRIVRANGSPLVPGDRVTITTGAGERVLEVSEIRGLLDDNKSPEGLAARLFVVTCRSLGGGDESLVRFVWDARQNVPALTKAEEQASL